MIGKESGQFGFGDVAVLEVARKPGFLDSVNERVVWRALAKHLKKAFKNSPKGRRSDPPLVLFKVLLLQQWYNLSDPMAEKAVAGRLSFRGFVSFRCGTR